MRCAARCYTLAILCAYNKGTFLVMRHNNNASCAGQNRLRNSLIRHRQHLIDDICSTVQAVAQLRVLRTCGNHSGGHRQSTKYTNCFFHCIASQIWIAASCFYLTATRESDGKSLFGVAPQKKWGLRTTTVASHCRNPASPRSVIPPYFRSASNSPQEYGGM